MGPPPTYSPTSLLPPSRAPRYYGGDLSEELREGHILDPFFLQQL